MEPALGIAVGSSLQIAMFVARALVIVRQFYRARSHGRGFSPPRCWPVLAIFLSVQITSQIASDGESTWLDGVLLFAVY